MLAVLDGDPADAEAGPLVKQVVAQHGDIRQLLANCEAIAAYNGDNYYPLMWRFYRSHRSTLFRVAHTLGFVSTTRDTSVMDALEVVLANEDRTGDYLPAGVAVAADRPGAGRKGAATGTASLRSLCLRGAGGGPQGRRRRR